MHEEYVARVKVDKFPYLNSTVADSFKQNFIRRRNKIATCILQLLFI